MRKCFLLICIIIVLTGCSKDKIVTDNNSISNVSSKDNNNFTEAETVTEFKGISSSANTPELGNLSSSINNNGYICNYNETLFFRNVNGNEYLYRKDKNGEKTQLIDKRAFSINAFEDYIYFISDDQNNAICRIDTDGENFTILSEEKSYLLLVSNDCIYYTNEEGNLYQLSLDGKEARLISDDQCAWPNIYREYIIYTSFADKCQLVGININTGESIQIADYGFSPVVYEDRICFQDKSGNVNVIDLKTGESIDYVNQWGQRICPTKNGLYFSNSTDVFYYKYTSKELQTIPIASPDPRHEITVYTKVELVYCDENSIYYLLNTGDKRDFVYLNIQTGDIYKL